MQARYISTDQMYPSCIRNVSSFFSSSNISSPGTGPIHPDRSATAVREGQGHLLLLLRPGAYEHDDHEHDNEHDDDDDADDGEHDDDDDWDDSIVI